MAQPQVHDVVVVGSGAAGAIAAHNLTQQGVSVLLLDAGAHVPLRVGWQHLSPDAYRQRTLDAPVPDPYLSFGEQPYTTAGGRAFHLRRVWGLGGKMNVWGRVSLRFAEADFREPEKDGWGEPWPIGYADVAPYYDKLDQLIGVCGGADDSEVLPGSRFHLPPPAPRCGEALLQRAARKLGMSPVANRSANLTQPRAGLGPCHYCGICDHGCERDAYFNPATRLLAPAVLAGRLRIIENAVVARLLTDPSGRVRSVQYFERHTGAERVVQGRTFVLAASCVDTTRILLNSRSAAHPGGIGNSADQLGRNYCEHQLVSAMGFAAELLGTQPNNDDGIGCGHLYIPRFNHQRQRSRGYLRGFGFQTFTTGAERWNSAFVTHFTRGYGAAFKNEVRRRYPATVALHAFGEVLPRAENRITVNPSTTDRYGVPVPHLDVTYGENERRMAEDIFDVTNELFEALGAEPHRVTGRGQAFAPGTTVHELGTCRMGKDPRRSVVNPVNQVHDAPEVFVVDGAAFVSASEKNPTHTIMALAWRATDHLVQELGRRNL